MTRGDTAAGRLAMRPALLAGLAVPCLLMLAGCGESVPHGRSATDTVRQFLRAAAARDGGTACALLSDEGRATMAAYPKPAPPSARTTRTCEETVAQLDQLPHAEQWKAMSRGDITSESTSGGLDEQTVTVSYSHDATTHVEAMAKAMAPVALLNSVIDVPPFPR